MMNNYHLGLPSSSRVNKNEPILAPSGNKIIGHGLSASKIDPRRNDLRLYESMLGHGCQKPFLHAILAMRHMNLWHSYKMEISKDALSNPSKDKWIKAMK